MNQLLFHRSTGSLSSNGFARIQSTQLVYDIQLTASLRFDGGETTLTEEDDAEISNTQTYGDGGGLKLSAHQSGVNALVADRFEGRFLLSGGADASIRIWDLHYLTSRSKVETLKPRGIISRGPATHKFGITQLSFYPFDSAAFLSSSYDHTLKLYATETLAVSASFDLDSIVYTHALSPISSHLLVACATQHPTVRLVDLRSGCSSHSLAGHQGAVLSVGWNPTSEYILASGDTSGTVRVWDVRKSAGTLGLLDMEDSVGVGSVDGLGSETRSRLTGKAHNGAVNGLSWTDDGAFIITAGHDQRVRVWDSATGANTLASFGPILKNANLSTVPLLVTPTAVTPPGQEILFYPNEHEILLFHLHEGRLLSRLKVPGPTTAAVRSRSGERNIRNRLTSLAWGGVVDGVFSGHSDGQIRVWAPKIASSEDEEEDGKGDDIEANAEAGVKRKRAVLEDIFRDLTRQKITLG